MKEDMTVLIPTRGRPHNMLESIRAMRDTETKAFVYYILSADDPELRNYYDAFTSEVTISERFSCVTVRPEVRGCMPPTNLAVELDFTLGRRCTAWMGDDHRPRTRNWDQIYDLELYKLGGTGVVFGNDLGQGANLPTQVCISADIIYELGYFCPPEIRHLYCDNVWMKWGEGIDRIKYLPDVIVEHMHPGFGKAVVDEGYAFSGSAVVDEVDREAYIRYLNTGYLTDIEKLKGLL